MRKIESTIDNKMKSFFTSMQNVTSFPNETFQVPKNETAQKIVKNDGSDNGAVSETIVLDDSSIDLNDTVKMSDAPSCSTVIRPRVAHLPNQDKVEQEAKKRKLTNCILSRTTVDVFAVPLPPKRRNVDLSSTAVEETIDDSYFNNSVVQCPPVRRSNRISVRETTIREAQMQSQLNVTKIQRKTKVEKREPKQKVKNEVVAAYFGSNCNVATAKVTQNSHQKAILDVFNTGTFKELQNLPTIGLKTAYQIVSYRCVHGKFKKIDDIKNVPIMIGKIWDKFVIVSFHHNFN